MINPKKVLIVEGGGSRCVFSFGVTDSFIRSFFDPFDMYLGVSNGTMVLFWYLMKETDNNLDKMLLVGSKKYINYKNIFSNKDIMDFEKLFKDGEKIFPVDFNKLLRNLVNKKYYVVTTDAETAKAEYFEPTKYDYIKKFLASGTLPILMKKPRLINGRRKFDGGISDPLPVKKAYDLGARYIVVIRTYEEKFIRSLKIENYLASWYTIKYPKLSKALLQHANTYNEALNFIKNPPSDCKIIQICPPSRLRVKRDTINTEIMRLDYELGIKMGIEFLIRNKF